MDRPTLRLTASQFDRIAQIWSQGGTVAFPTETVFGLGANALDPSAVNKIFQAKRRPSDNPLIVHVGGLDQVPALTRSIPTSAIELWEKFGPSPMTLVLPKSDRIPDCVSAGLPSVGIRIPSHPVALKLLQHARLPIAAPSANRSGTPSATTWQAVLEDLDGKIDAIVCEEGCWHGIESTVLDLTGDRPAILRPGSITWEMIAQVLPDLLPLVPHYANPSDLPHAASQPLPSPGLRHPHYQPRAKVEILSEPWLQVPTRLPAPLAYIGLTHWPPCDHGPALQQTHPSVDSYAKGLYEFFRQADRFGCQTIVCQPVDPTGVGWALMDRLRRAADRAP
ncbi:MAG: L-threonylcarbamoyladenylate synthase [Pirellulaceae bacterium]